MSDYWGSVHEQVTLYKVTFVRLLGECVGEKKIYTVLHVPEYWDRVYETSNFIECYMCKSTGGV